MGVSPVKHDLLSGILYGVVIGLFFTAQLGPHLPLLVIVAVLFGAKMISLK
jgi:F0F1-type ATP synthase assembly protein I